MKISLLTIWHCYNYGAEMQAYATYKALTSLGNNVEIIDYRLGYDGNSKIRRKIVATIVFFTPHYWKFRFFWKHYFKSITKRYVSFADLKDHPPLSDMYVVGSDQVWNEAITKDKAEAYFLGFGDIHVKRASYSSSFGVSTWSGSPYITAIAKKQFKTFYGISCREKTGLNLLSETFDVHDAINTLDPTLLYKDYNEITGPIQARRSLVYYPLSYEERALFPICRKLAKKYGLTFVNANPIKLIPRTSIIWNRNSIKKWLKSIAEAQFVVTASFHGLAFSLIYHKQFAIVNVTQNSLQSRILDLLTILGLQDRYFSSVKEFEESDIFDKTIDYVEVERRLNVEREKSWNYIKRIMS